jgi:hypothetical protein
MRRKQWGAPPVHMHIDAAQHGHESVPLALGRELQVSFGHLAKVVREARQLALRVLPQVRPEEVSPVVQDDLHKPSIRPGLSLRDPRLATYFVDGL